MHDVYEESSFDQKMFVNGLNMGLPLQVWVKRQSMEGKYTDSLVKKKFSEQLPAKKNMVTFLWDRKWPMSIDFLKRYN